CRNGSIFKFLGVRQDPGKIKGFEGVDICWIEEAEKVSEASWKFLIPTIRKESSEIWISFNPDQETDPTAKRFLLNPPPEAKVEKIGWEDNPWFPAPLKREKDHDYKVDAEAAAWTWGGHFRKTSEAQIFKGRYTVEAFDPYEFAKDGKTLLIK